MNERMSRILVVGAILLSAATFLLQIQVRVSAEPDAITVPQVISYQGQLTNSSGAPLTGAYTMTFRLYNVASGGSTLWSENYTAVSVANGVFQVLLGSQTPIPDAVFDQSALYLGVTVGSDAEMTPRRRVASVGYAYRANDAATLDGFQADDFALKNALDAADGSPQNAVYVDNAGEVGIGTTAPGTALDVAGDLHVSGDISADSQPAFHAQAIDDSYQSIPSGAWTKVILNDEHLDVAGDFANSRFTAPSAGIYSLSGYLVWNSTATDFRYQVRLTRNGTDYEVLIIDVKTIGHDGALTSEGSAFSFVTQLDADDYIEMEVYQYTGNAQNLGNWSYLSGFKVS